MWSVSAGQAAVREAGRCCPPLCLGVGQSLILLGVHPLTLCFSLRVFYLFLLLFLSPWVTISDSTIPFFDVFFIYLSCCDFILCSIYKKFFWLKSSLGHSQASCHIQMNLKRLSYELQFPFLMVWSLLIIDAVALLVLGSGIKSSLHSHLCLVGCSRVGVLMAVLKSKSSTVMCANSSLVNTPTGCHWSGIPVLIHHCWG